LNKFKSSGRAPGLFSFWQVHRQDVDWRRHQEPQGHAGHAGDRGDMDEALACRRLEPVEFLVNRAPHRTRRSFRGGPRDGAAQ
jgi:hypothetical protein